jgi:hypothetical protein
MLALLLAAAATCPAPTPEAALRRIEEAYRSKDIEAVVACKSFRREAQLMLANLKEPKLKEDPEVVAKVAETLEQAFRAELGRNGFPEMKGVVCRIVDKATGDDKDVITATEECVYPDGGKSLQRIQLAKVGNDWRVLAPPAP